jgi:hypothetical protein
MKQRKECQDSPLLSLETGTSQKRSLHLPLHLDV